MTQSKDSAAFVQWWDRYATGNAGNWGKGKNAHKKCWAMARLAYAAASESSLSFGAWWEMVSPVISPKLRMQCRLAARAAFVEVRETQHKKTQTQYKETKDRDMRLRLGEEFCRWWDTGRDRLRLSFASSTTRVLVKTMARAAYFTSATTSRSFWDWWNTTEELGGICLRQRASIVQTCRNAFAAARQEEPTPSRIRVVSLCGPFPPVYHPKHEVLVVDDPHEDEDEGAAQKKKDAWDAIKKGIFNPPQHPVFISGAITADLEDVEALGASRIAYEEGQRTAWLRLVQAGRGHSCVAWDLALEDAIRRRPFPFRMPSNSEGMSAHGSWGDPSDTLDAAALALAVAKTTPTKQKPIAKEYEEQYGHKAKEETGDPLDVQEGGDHYKTMGIQPVEYIEANGIGFCAGSVIKYVSRYKRKNGLEDLKKARHFVDLLIAQEYPEEKEQSGA